jgi:hypothetical protein
MVFKIYKFFQANDIIVTPMGMQVTIIGVKKSDPT